MTDRKGRGENAGALGTIGSNADLAAAIVQTIDQPLLILGAELTVEDAHSAFYELFQVGAEETRGRPLYELGDGQWDIPELHQLLEKTLPERSVVKGYRIEHDFPNLGKRIMILNAQRLPADHGRPELILLVISDRTEAEQARFELESASGRVEIEWTLHAGQGGDEHVGFR